jgi:hypothetical protein
MPDCAKIAVQIGKAASTLLDCTPKFDTKASSCAYDRQCIFDYCLTQHDSCMQRCLLKAFLVITGVHYYRCFVKQAMQLVIEHLPEA